MGQVSVFDERTDREIQAEEAWGDVAVVAAGRVLDFFRSGDEQREKALQDAKVGLGAGSNYARIYASATNRMSVRLAERRMNAIAGTVERSDDGGQKRLSSESRDTKKVTSRKHRRK